jgi:hypothetical protein
MFVYTRSLATATATASKAKEVLPLKGIKVLDMTRVLAGVSFFFHFPSFSFSLFSVRSEFDLGQWDLGSGE